MYTAKVLKIVEFGEEQCYDIWVWDDRCLEGNFFIDTVNVHNSIPTAVNNRDDETESWKHEINDLILEIVEDTYGVLVYQEQVQRILQKIAGFTSPEAQETRKAVAKKWTKKLKAIKEKWLRGAERTIGKDEAEKYWDILERFGRYAFNKCLCQNTKLTNAKTGETRTIKDWYESGEELYLESYDGSNIVENRVIEITPSGDNDIYEVTFEDGSTEFTTLDHKFLCEDGQYHAVEEIFNQGLEITVPKS